METLILKYCVNIPLTLVLGMIQVESSGNPKASHAGNQGLMQIRLATARMLNCDGVKTSKDLLDLEKNIKCGCKYLEEKREIYGDDPALIIAAYNAGKVYYNKSGKLVNQAHVDKVLRATKKIQIQETWGLSEGEQ